MTKNTKAKCDHWPRTVLDNKWRRFIECESCGKFLGYLCFEEDDKREREHRKAKRAFDNLFKKTFPSAL